MTLPPRPFLYAIIDSTLAGERSLSSWVEELCGDGRARVVQWRAKELDDADFFSGAREIQAAARRAGALFVVNDRPDVAKILDADGVHVGQDDLNPADVRRLLPKAIIGVSTHNADQLAQAATSPADYIAVGPVFATSTKADPDPVVGLDFVRTAAALVKSHPVIGIGGITLASAPSVIEAGASGVALISELMRSKAPRDHAQSVMARMKGL